MLSTVLSVGLKALYLPLLLLSHRELTISLVGLAPTEHVHLIWTHSFVMIFQFGSQQITNFYQAKI
jgi:hypothetical protein